MESNDKTPKEVVVKSEFTPLINNDNEVKFLLKRNLTFWHGFSFIVGMLLGSGLFISPALVAASSPNMFVAILWWIAGGLLAALGASCYCELSCLFKKTGSTYIFLAGTYGQVIGFMYVWIEAVIISPTVASILAFSAGSYMARPFYNDETSESFIWTARLIGLALFLLLSIINCIGVKEFGFASNIFAISQLLIVLLLIGLGIWQLASTKNFDNFTPEEVFRNSANPFSWSSVQNFGLAMYAVLWAYEGWSCVPYLMEEMENPSKNIPLVTFTALPFVSFICVLINLALMTALSIKEMGDAETVAITMAIKVAGKNFSYVMPILVAVCCFGALNPSIYITGRAYLAAAREGQFPSVLAYIHKTRRTPIPAIVANAVLTIAWMFVGDSAQTFINYFNFVMWITYVLAFIAIPILRHTRPTAERTYQVFIVTPVFMSIVSFVVSVLGFAAAPQGSAISLFLILLSLPLYYIFLYKRWAGKLALKRLSDFGQKMTEYLNLVPCDVEDIE